MNIRERLIFGGIMLSIAIAAVSTGTAWPLLAGWMSFLARVLPQITIAPESIVFSLLVFVLLIGGVHITARWLYGEMGPPESKLWRFRSSFAIVASVLAFFTAGIAIVGIVHQTTWLFTREAKWYEPRILSYSDDSRRNLREIALGLHEYHGQRHAFPLGGEFDSAGDDLCGWGLAAIPSHYYAPGLDRSKPWDHPPNAEVLRAPLPVLLNPAIESGSAYDANGYGVSHYAANQHVMGLQQSLSLEDLEGASGSTLLVGEINDHFRPWPGAHNVRDPLLGINSSPDGFGGPRNQSGAYFAMADGSVKFVADKIDPVLLRKMSAVDFAEKKRAAAGH